MGAQKSGVERFLHWNRDMAATAQIIENRTLHQEAAKVMQAYQAEVKQHQAAVAFLRRQTKDEISEITNNDALSDDDKRNRLEELLASDDIDGKRLYGDIADTHMRHVLSQYPEVREAAEVNFQGMMERTAHNFQQAHDAGRSRFPHQRPEVAT